MSKKIQTTGLRGFSWEGYERYENYKAKVESKDMTALTRHIEGQMLTIADASFTDQEQRKAVKNIISQTLWGDTYGEIQRYLFQKEKNEEYTFPF